LPLLPGEQLLSFDSGDLTGILPRDLGVVMRAAEVVIGITPQLGGRTLSTEGGALARVVERMERKLERLREKREYLPRSLSGLRLGTEDETEEEEAVSNDKADRIRSTGADVEESLEQSRSASRAASRTASRAGSREPSRTRKVGMRSRRQSWNGDRTSVDASMDAEVVTSAAPGDTRELEGSGMEAVAGTGQDDLGGILRSRREMRAASRARSRAGIEDGQGSSPGGSRGSSREDSRAGSREVSVTRARSISRTRNGGIREGLRERLGRAALGYDVGHDNGDESAF
jgi:hypothetical protein